MPEYDQSTQKTVVPTTENAWKFELFLHDKLQAVDRLGILAIDRRLEFAPIKNAEGSASDTPSQAVTECLA